jgi:hypothetical protein
MKSGRNSRGSNLISRFSIETEVRNLAPLFIFFCTILLLSCDGRTKFGAEILLKLFLTAYTASLH